MIKVNEIFHSLQGEGPRAGQPTIFVRMQGCNYRCKWCDTVYAQDGAFVEACPEESVIETVEALSKFHGTRWVCITGGEPTFQFEALNFLVMFLWTRGYRIEVETNGSAKYPEQLSQYVTRWLWDIKLPGSGISEQHSYNIQECKHLRQRDAIVCVATDKRDLDHLYRLLKQYAPLAAKIYVHAAWGTSLVTVADWLLDCCASFASCGLDVRLGVQLHKLVWGPTKRGV